MVKKAFCFVVIVVSLLASGCNNKPRDMWEEKKTGKDVQAIIPPGTSGTGDENNTPIPKGQLVVHYIDVGEGDSILIQRGREAMLIDAGGEDRGVEVVNYLKGQGIKQLEYLFGTHPEDDHIGGLDDVIDSFAIGSIYMPDVYVKTEAFRNAIASMNKKGLRDIPPKPGEVFKLGEADITVLAPNSDKYDALGDYSIAIKLVYNDTSFLFTGDGGEVSEKEILSKKYDISADVIKIGSHGSKNSSSRAYLDKVKPQYAVISLGEDNSLDHPDRSLMKSLQDMGVKVYRTDESGTIVAVSDGREVSFNCSPVVFEKDDGIKIDPAYDEGREGSRFAASSGEWVYYHQVNTGQNNGSGIYRLKSDGRGKSLLAETYEPDFLIDGDWIYYRDSAIEFEGEDQVLPGRLYKMKVDGSNKTMLSQDNTRNIFVSGDYIYYTNSRAYYKKQEDNEPGVYRIKKDGTGKVELSGDNAWGLYVSDNMIYYVNGRMEGNTIFSMKPDGSGRCSICEGIGPLNIKGDLLYYYDHLSKSISSINKDGTGKTGLSPAESLGGLAVSGDNVFFSDGIAGGIYRMKPDGRDKVKISGDIANRLDIAGEWLYYSNGSAGGKTYRIRPDGTGRDSLDR